MLPSEGSVFQGFGNQLNKNPVAELVGRWGMGVRTLVTGSQEDWSYQSGAGPDYEGSQGFTKSRDEMDRLAKAFTESRQSTHTAIPCGSSM